jgi:hypothetical protein
MLEEMHHDSGRTISIDQLATGFGHGGATNWILPEFFDRSCNRDTGSLLRTAESGSDP